MKYIVDAFVLYKEQIYVEADSPEEARKLAQDRQGIRIGKPERSDRVHSIGVAEETNLDI